MSNLLFCIQSYAILFIIEERSFMWLVVSFLNDVVGINEVKLKKLSYELITYRDDIRNILSKYSDIIKKTELYFNGDVATEFRGRFNDFSNNFLVVNNTFLNYSNDMLSLIDSYVHEENSTIMVDK